MTDHIDPQQEIFSLLLLKLKEKYGKDVYDGPLPPDETEYPFIYIGDSQQTDTKKKDIIIGKVYQTVHVWHNNVRQRGVVSAMLLDIKQAARSLQYGKYYHWDLDNSDQRILPDDTTDTPLLHGVVDLEFSFD